MWPLEEQIIFASYMYAFTCTKQEEKFKDFAAYVPFTWQDCIAAFHMCMNDYGDAVWREKLKFYRCKETANQIRDIINNAPLA